MGRGRRQTVTGVVVNAHPNVPRAEYDVLKATLHRASLDGPEGLDPTVLLGRIAWVESLNPSRGAKLRGFATITWHPPLHRGSDPKSFGSTAPFNVRGLTPP